MVDQYARELHDILNSVANALEMSRSIFQYESTGSPVETEFGPPTEREQVISTRIQAFIDYITTVDAEKSQELRYKVVDLVPSFLLAYQALRFRNIDSEAQGAAMPTKETLSEFPTVVAETGLYMPVSKLLRLVAVSLTDEAAKRRIVEGCYTKALMSHMVDDPLNPLQRECAVFAINVLTRDFEPAQRAISQIMSNR